MIRRDLSVLDKRFNNLVLETHVEIKVNIS